MILVNPRRTVVVNFDGLSLLAVEAVHDDRIAVVHRDRILAATRVTEQHGVTVGMRSAEARARFPDLELRERDGYREEQWLSRLQRMFDDVSPHFRRNGHTLTAPLGPITRYFTTETRALAAIDAIGVSLVQTYPQLTVELGVADSLFAASVAAPLGRRVPSGESAQFVGGLSVGTLLPSPMAVLLREVGLERVLDFQNLEPAVVAARFGGVGLHWHRLCRLEVDLSVVDDASAEIAMCTAAAFDGDTIEQLSFRLMRSLEDLLSVAEEGGLVLVKACLTLVTTTGELTKVVEMLDGVGTTGLIARLRWFEEVSRPRRDPLIEVRIEPMQWSSPRRRQLTFDRQELKESAVLATLARLATFYGDDRVLVPTMQGGRSLRERGTWIPWSGRWPLSGVSADDSRAPWPGHLPGATPSLVYRYPQEVQLLDTTDTPVEVVGDGVMTQEPAFLVIGRNRLAVSSFFGPWVVIERWWERRRRRYVRLMVITPQGTKLIVRESRRWWLEGAFA